MSTLTALNSLRTMWLLIYNSRGRKLTREERIELEHLCELIHLVPNRGEFNEAAAEFCSMFESCGVFESGVVNLPERVLEYIDRLQEMLRSPDDN